MKKNLLNKTAAAEIIDRVQALQQHAPAAWGEMNATEMLYHCNLANTQILEGTQAYRKSSFKQYLLRFLSLYIVPKFPKHMKGAPVNDTKDRIPATRFEEQRQQFIDIVSRFAGRQQPIQLVHPAFGYINTKQWGVAAWMHMDHHLRQFGV